MSSKTNCFLLILFSLPLWSTCQTISSSCPENCGRIYIPYPFGIGKGCYLENWYAIECVNNSVPILSIFGKEVVSIHLLPLMLDPPSDLKTKVDQSIRIKTRILSKGCSSDGDEVESSTMNLTGTPFYFDDSISLIAVGCNNTSSLTHIEPTMVGCKSSCGTKYHTPTKDFLAKFNCYIPRDSDYNYCAYDNIMNETICNGNGCCQANMPGGFQQILGVKIDNETTTKGCKVAFLTDKTFKSHGANPQRLYATQYSTIRLGWFIHTTNRSYEDSLGCSYIKDKNPPSDNIRCNCDHDTYLNYSSCLCSAGYEGNPYVMGGCEDVDECLWNKDDPTFDICRGGTCINTEGGYRCVYTNHRSLAIGLGASFGSLIFVGGIYFLFIFIQKQRSLHQKKKFFKRNGGLLLQQQLSSTKGNIEKTKVFSSSELEKATENFSLKRILGQGGQGTVYKGMLVDGRIVAVKKSKIVDEDKLEEFINEVVILSQINHRNIVKILGCCLETDVPVLVYEFIPNGNLFEHLHDESDVNTMVTWDLRLRIAVDIARALSYLHSSASSPIYHRDIKSTNIMLDEKYRAKVSDFGTSRSVTIDHTHLTTVVSGTAGYVDPEYFQSSQFTEKSDVYSFGVVLVELITGEKSISYLRSQENRTLSTYFLQVMKENKLFDIIDARVKDDCKLNQVTATAKLAKKCLNLKGRKRPNMREVSMELEKIQSTHGDRQQPVYVSDNEEAEGKDEGSVIVNNGMESPNNVVVTAPTSQYNIVKTSSSSWSDVEPLFPLQTW